MSSRLFYSKQIASVEFRADTIKEAYMKAVKWYASSIIAKDKLHNIQVEFVKREEDDSKAVILKLFAVLSENESMESQCKCCKEMNALFFIGKQTDCSKCQIASYEKRLNDMISIKSKYYADLLKSK